ncbi:MAG: DNA/RNA nuclease SfsA [Alphaproteobacteria bacterium]|nr:DNA/RNA nuclease SfsA [Alphaproteobacteria bacterium]
MEFQKPLKRVHFLKRYKRFLADVYSKEMDLTLTVHCPNSGSMKGIFENTPQPIIAWMSGSDNPNRKLPYTLEMIETEHGLVGVNTQNPNKIVKEAIEQGKIATLLGYETIRTEVRYGTNSRIDLLLESPEKPKAYVEVKNVSMREEGVLIFPDAVTERGTKHLLELIQMVKEGHRAVMLFLSQRSDCNTFSVAESIDPLYAKTLRNAIREGVEVLAYRCTLTVDAIKIKDQMRIHL